MLKLPSSHLSPRHWQIPTKEDTLQAQGLPGQSAASSSTLLSGVRIWSAGSLHIFRGITVFEFWRISFSSFSQGQCSDLIACHSSHRRVYITVREHCSTSGYLSEVCTTQVESQRNHYAIVCYRVVQDFGYHSICQSNSYVPFLCKSRLPMNCWVSLAQETCCNHKISKGVLRPRQLESFG